MNCLGIITGADGHLAKNVINVLDNYCDKVFLTDITYDKETIQKDKYEKINLDVTDEQSVKSFFQSIDYSDFNKSILINMAAIDYKVSEDGPEFNWSIENSNIDNLRQSLDVSLVGTFLVSKYFCINSVENNLISYVLNFASDLSILISNDSVYNSFDNHKPVDYAIAKHGLLGLTKYFAVYYAKNNIRVNAISPSGVANNQSKEFVEAYEKLAPMNRMIEAQEIEGAVDFLISDKSSFITGQNIILDGGKSLW